MERKLRNGNATEVCVGGSSPGLEPWCGSPGGSPKAEPFALLNECMDSVEASTREERCQLQPVGAELGLVTLRNKKQLQAVQNLHPSIQMATLRRKPSSGRARGTLEHSWP